MNLPLAYFIIRLLEAYFILGLLLAAGIAWRGLRRLDPAAAHGTAGFRLLILPGLAALWPLMLSRVIRGTGRPPGERNAHRDAAHSRT